MDVLELHMGERGLDERRRRLGLVIQESLEVLQALVQLIRRGRHEHRVAGPRAADPIAGPTILGWCIIINQDSALTSPEVDSSNGDAFCMFPHLSGMHATARCVRGG